MKEGEQGAQPGGGQTRGQGRLPKGPEAGDQESQEGGPILRGDLSEFWWDLLRYEMTTSLRKMIPRVDKVVRRKVANEGERSDK